MDAFLDNLPGDLGKRPKGRRRKRAVRKGPGKAPGHKPVIYHVVKCPVCDSAKCPVVRTVRPVRYHKCVDCGHRFKSVEKIG